MERKKRRTPAVAGWSILLAAAGVVMAASSGWTVMASPSPGSSNFLYSVATISNTDAWAVGYDYDANSHQFIVTQHWDGSKWSLVSGPSPGTGKKCGDPSYAANSLYGVGAIASHDVWAVGQICTYSNSRTLTEHWDGNKWTVVPSPNEPGLNASTLVAVAAIATNDVWAVGNYEIVGKYHWNTLIEHWDSTKWSIVESPNPSGAYESFLNAIRSRRGKHRRCRLRSFHLQIFGRSDTRSVTPGAIRFL